MYLQSLGGTWVAVSPGILTHGPSLAPCCLPAPAHPEPLHLGPPHQQRPQAASRVQPAPHLRGDAGEGAEPGLVVQDGALVDTD